MKTPIAFITIACALLLLNVCSLKAQVYNLNQAAGTISVLNEEYVDDMDMEWNINAGQDSRITFTYIAEMEGASYDYIDIYTVNSSGVPTLLLTIDAVEYEVYGTITTTISSGRAKVVFVSDYSNCYDSGYKGFKIQFSASNSYTTPEMIGYQGNTMLYPKVGIGTLEPMEALDVNGNVRVNGKIWANNGYWEILKISSSQGYIELNPLSSDYANIKTDRSKFLFDKPIYLQNGVLSAYSTNNLSLQTNGTTRMTISSNNGNVGIGALVPDAKLHILQTLEDYSSGFKIVGSTSAISGRIWMGAEKLHIDNATAGTGTGFTFKRDGNIGLGVDDPAVKLHIDGSVRGNIGNTGALRVSTTQGYIDIGPRITSYANFDTNQSRFLFNSPIYIENGALSAYSTNNLSLQTNGTTRMTISYNNGNVGIGALVPEAKLHILQTSEDFSSGIKIVGNSSPISGRIWMGAEKLHVDNAQAGTGTGFTFKRDGNIGLGVDDPAVKLHIAGSIRGNSTNGSLKIESNSGYVEIGPQNSYDAHISTNMESFVFNKSLYSATGVFGSLNTSDLIFKTDSIRMTILRSNGNVGIGKTVPDYKLDVAGVIRCSEVLVQDINQIADFVFKPDYDLPSLNKVNQFILTNGHLPGIPSETEVKEKGMGLVEMQVKLLQKVEELTLYIIEQEKRISQLESELNNQ